MKGEVLAYVVIGCHPRLVHCFFFYPVFQHGQTVEAISSVYQVCETKNSRVVDEGF